MRNAMPIAHEYRDDRMYVMRISSNFKKSNDGVISAAISQDRLRDLEGAVLLITYRNTHSLPAVRTDEFETMDDALSYIKRIEPTCPRVSLGGKAVLPTPSWESHLEWLHSEGLQSVTEADCPLPQWVKDAS